jgi:hypothetical protein
VKKGADLYEVLGVSPSASPAELKAAYRDLARRHHPDHARTYVQRVVATRRMQVINAAYDVLRDPQRRAAYDAAGVGFAPKRCWWAADDPAAGGPPPWLSAWATPHGLSLGMVVVGAAVVLLVAGRAHWSIAVLFLCGQLAYCYWTDCLDDGVWGLGFGLLAFWWIWSRLHDEGVLGGLVALVFPYGIDWQAALGAASGLSAIFIGVRQLRREGRPLLG